MFHPWTTILPALVSVLGAVAVPAGTAIKPVQLTLHRLPSSGCKVISQRQLPAFKDLDVNLPHYVVIESRPLLHERELGGRHRKTTRGLTDGQVMLGREREEDASTMVTRLVGWSEEQLSASARELCPGGLDWSQLDQSDPYSSQPYAGQLPFINVPESWVAGELQAIPGLPVGSGLLPLHTSPPSPVVDDWAANRISLVFLGDGYTLAEKEKFYRDAQKLADDLVVKETYESVTPLLNVWAVFVPSRMSGIGVDSQPLDTAFGLYRDGTELRGIYCSKRKAAHDACEAAMRAVGSGARCDYPLLLANSPWYGGLGGEFSITTASEVNGPIVLRHELGHSILWVGEEYDGGYAYFGANAAKSLFQVGDRWGAWLSNKSLTSQPNPTPRAERSVVPVQAYAWHNLSEGPFSVSFNASGTYPHNLLRFSLSGIESAAQMRIYLDGKEIVDWGFDESIGKDRKFYTVGDVGGSGSRSGLALGKHEIKFELTGERPGAHGTLAAEQDIIRQMCSVEVVEYGAEDEFHGEEGYVGAYPTFSMWDDVTYRPTSESCLMRNNSMTALCGPCKEALWLSLLRQTSLIDSLDWSFEASTVKSAGSRGQRHAQDFADVCSDKVRVRVQPLPLGHLRRDGSGARRREALDIEWFEGDNKRKEWDGKEEVVIPLGRRVCGDVAAQDLMERWTVRVTFRSPEVRTDRKGYLTETKSWAIAP